MRYFWTFFVFGLLCVILSTWSSTEINASSESAARIKKIEDRSISGLRIPVPSTAEMETSLVKKEKELEERELRLKDLEKRLAVEEERIKIQIEDLQKLQDQIASANKESEARTKAVVAKLVKTFESMEPKKAASVIMIMNDDLATDLLDNMKEKKVAMILTEMDPNRAMVLSTLVAKRRPAAQSSSEVQVQQ